jgi:hypothetical protein
LCVCVCVFVCVCVCEEVCLILIRAQKSRETHWRRCVQNHELCPKALRANVRRLGVVQSLSGETRRRRRAWVCMSTHVCTLIHNYIIYIRKQLHTHTHTHTHTRAVLSSSHNSSSSQSSQSWSFPAYQAPLSPSLSAGTLSATASPYMSTATSQELDSILGPLGGGTSRQPFLESLQYSDFYMGIILGH